MSDHPSTFHATMAFGLGTGARRDGVTGLRGWPRRTRVAVVATALAVSGGCGGGSDASTASADPGAASAGPAAATSLPGRPNNPPVVARGLTHQKAVAFHAVDYDMSGAGAAFRDPDGDPLSYELRWGAAAPRGLEFNGTRITGATPDVGEFNAIVIVRDGRGGELTDGILLDVRPNAAPSVAKTNGPQLVEAGALVDYDALQGGATFSTDPEGDPLDFTVELSGTATGLVATGTRIRGSIHQPGAVRVQVIATDAFGASTRDEFLVAVAAPAPGRPGLPSTPYAYADSRLPLPPAFRTASVTGLPLWDTTPAGNRTTDAGAALGRVLFYDRRLSITNTHSCATCHEQARGFANGTRFSRGVTGEAGKRNAMGLTGVRYNIRDSYFSDMRTLTLENVALQPVEDRIELGNTLQLLIPKLGATDFYPPMFEAAFGSREITGDRIARALAQFLRSLISYSAKIDQVENPPLSAPTPVEAEIFTPREFAGFSVWMGARCFACHHDTTRSTFDASNNGLDVTPADAGQGNGRFRNASLRNIAVTAPYMHDGRFPTLRDVVEHYDNGVKESPDLHPGLAGPTGPKRLNLSDADKDALVAFLETFTDTGFLTDPKFSDPFPP